MNHSKIIIYIKFIAIGLLSWTLMSCHHHLKSKGSILETHPDPSLKLISQAKSLLFEKPITVTNSKAERSAGGMHDYFLEGRYWWPNPEDPQGPYIRRDGERNPENFIAHSKAMKNFSDAVTLLTAAYIMQPDVSYLNKIKEHLNAWMVDSATLMNPHLLYSQAIKGINTGRGIGIIDAVEMIEVANCCRYLAAQNLFTTTELEAYKKWFEDFAIWMTSHQYGIDEQNNNNNHSTWWGAQLAAYSLFAERKDLFKISQQQFENQLNIQMASDGSFPDELARTKPFGYTTYNLNAWTNFALLASTENKSLAKYPSKNGTLKKAIDFFIPYFSQQKVWPYYTSLEKELHPQASDFLILGYWLYKDAEYLDLWKKLSKQNDALKPNLIVLEKLIN